MSSELAVVGAALLLAGLFARVGRRLGLPTIPFFIAAGIVFGPHTPGFVVLDDPDELHLLAMLGLVLLLFHLGIEFSIYQLLGGGRRLLQAGGSYIALNTGTGLVLGARVGDARWEDRGEQARSRVSQLHRDCLNKSQVEWELRPATRRGLTRRSARAS